MQKKRILIVEDDGIIATHLNTLLTQRGYQVAGMTARGEDAVNLAGDLFPDLILLDIILAGKMNGLQTAAQIQQQQDIPIIFTTAHSDQELLEEAKLSTPYGYLHKPIREVDLFSTIEVTLYKHHLDQKMRISEERHRSLFNDAPVAILEIDFSNVIAEARKSARSAQSDPLTGDNISREHRLSLLEKIKFLAANREALDLLHLEDISQLSALLVGANSEVTTQVLQNLNEFFNTEMSHEFEWDVPIMLFDGKNIYLSGRMVFATGHEMSRDRVLLYIRDNTLRKQMEKDLKNANQQLSVLVDSLKEKERESSLLGQMGDFLQSCQKEEDVYHVAANYAGKLFREMDGALYIFPPSRGRLDKVESWGKNPPPGEGFSPEDCWAIRRGRYHLVESPRSRLICHHVAPDTPSPHICYPLMAQGEVLGSLYITGIPENRCQEVLHLAGVISERAALAISNLKLRDRLLQQSIQDSLTGLYNRLHMENTLERELTRAIRHNRSLSVVMLDIDYFKQLNDTYGHDAGDTVLQVLSRYFQTHIRSSDIACRYGGDEFTFILPETTLEDACKRMEELRVGVKRLVFDSQQQTLPSVSLSFGVSTYPQHGAFSRDLLLAADTALYHAKQTGRDRISAH